MKTGSPHFLFLKSERAYNDHEILPVHITPARGVFRNDSVLPIVRRLAFCLAAIEVINKCDSSLFYC